MNLKKKIYVINLSDTYIGRERLKLLQDHKILKNTFNRFEGVNGINQIDYYIKNNIITNSFINKYNNYIKLRPGEMGINATTYNLAKHVVDNNLNYIIVLEDDAINLDKYFAYKLQSFIKELPEDYDIGLLGYYLFTNDYD